jgi:anti-sigma B factor antagonist
MSVETAKADKFTMHHLEQCSDPSILRVEGSLRAPMHHELARRVETLLEGGERRLVLDLARLSEIDAAGVGELVEAFNRTSAAGGVLRIAHASRRVRTLLDLTGVSKLLREDPLANPS